MHLLLLSSEFKPPKGAHASKQFPDSTLYLRSQQIAIKPEFITRFLMKTNAFIFEDAL